MRTYNMTAVIWKEANAYVSKCPETGVASCDDTPEEALRNLKEAVELYLENAKRVGMLREIQDRIPSPLLGSSPRPSRLPYDEQAAGPLVR